MGLGVERSSSFGGEAVGFQSRGNGDLLASPHGTSCRQQHLPQGRSQAVSCLTPQALQAWTGPCSAAPACPLPHGHSGNTASLAGLQNSAPHEVLGSVHTLQGWVRRELTCQGTSSWDPEFKGPLTLNASSTGRTLTSGKNEQRWVRGGLVAKWGPEYWSGTSLNSSQGARSMMGPLPPQGLRHKGAAIQQRASTRLCWCACTLDSLCWLIPLPRESCTGIHWPLVSPGWESSHMARPEFPGSKTWG